VTLPITESLPPVLSKLSPPDNTHADGSSVTVKYILRSPSDLPIDKVDLLINGQSAGARDNSDDQQVKDCIIATHGLGHTDGALQGCRGSLTVDLSAGTTEIGVSALAGGKSSNTATIRVTR
jgi:hypothetical protein